MRLFPIRSLALMGVGSRAEDLLAESAAEAGGLSIDRAVEDGTGYGDQLHDGGDPERPDACQAR